MIDFHFHAISTLCICHMMTGSLVDADKKQLHCPAVACQAPQNADCECQFVGCITFRGSRGDSESNDSFCTCLFQSSNMFWKS